MFNSLLVGFYYNKQFLSQLKSKGGLHGTLGTPLDPPLENTLCTILTIHTSVVPVTSYVPDHHHL